MIFGARWPDPLGSPPWKLEERLTTHDDGTNHYDDTTINSFRHESSVPPEV